MNDRYEAWSLYPKEYSEVIEGESCPDCGGVLVKTGDDVQCENYGRKCDYITRESDDE